MSFPEVTDANLLNVRMKNVANQVYLCIRKDKQGKPILSTKTLHSEVDPDVDFSLYYYTSAEAGETKMVLPVHQNTKFCFSMTPSKEIQISSLVRKSDGNELDGELEDPMHFERADNRFFYIWKSGDNYALEAMDGEHRYYFLSLDDSNRIELKEVPDLNYPEETLFRIDEIHINSS
ncbi:hypothetical protein L9F63_027703 [Diploptera punctata]|uniref:Uncharacterized protein n=1 Tax=Diploptera punctata TaxID=6984 RepID=A0AAD8E0T7_DIPPU|nr:hypothetical protein L9F63_009099 [Diploptera punctata]KAJ9593056.1 hypothetical protein L9F63_027703 [Diploptera punctata]